MTLDEVEGRLLTLELETGLHVRHTVGRWHTLRFVARLYRWWTDQAQDQHKSHLVAHVAPTLMPMSRMRQMLAPLEGVGPKATRAAEAHFGTVHRAVNASVTDWAGLDIGGRRLGTKAAQAIVRFLRGS
jgi:ERCC4-type nuclease